MFLLFLLVTSRAMGFHEPDRPPLANLDLRPQPTVAKWLGKHSAFLTGPHADGKQAVTAFLNGNAAHFGHDASALGNAKVTRDFVGTHNGMRTMVWQQQVDGVSVFEGVLVAHTTKRGELVGVSSQFHPNPGNRKALRPLLPAAQAVTVATNDVGAASGTPTTRLVWLPVDGTTLTLCWEVVLTSRPRGEMFRILVDAQTGKLWIRRCLTEYYTDATYRVFTSDSPSPLSPGNSSPTTSQPAEIVRSLVTLTAVSSNASPNGWINDGDNTTLGNNVDAHLDRNGDNVVDPGSRPTGSPSRVFDFPLDLTLAPVAYTNAAVVQLFYWCNWMHDKLYDLGFTEAAGNFQTDNFGRGGLGNDALLADAQDSAQTNNANFSTPSDGSPPRIQMFLFNGPTPDRDSDLDAEVILHEYTHGLTNRRIGGGVGLSTLQSVGMGEGWSDFFALALLSEATDNVNSNYAMAAYSGYKLSAFTQNYYYGIRRYPYTTDLLKDPLTLKDIDPSQANNHPGIFRSPVFSTNPRPDETHRQGEVWCSALWDARANLIKKYGWATGNQLILQLVCDALNLSPANPTFLQARDAILQADLVLTGGANKKELWTAFAKRGMGVSATVPVNTSTTGVVEAFDAPDDLQVSPIGGGMVTVGPFGGPFMPGCADFTLINTGTNTLNWTANKALYWVNITPGSGSLAAGATGTVSVCANNSAKTLPISVYIDSLTFSNVTSGVPQYRIVQLRVQGFATLPFTETFESGAFSNVWSITGIGASHGIITTLNSPHSGTRHLTLDASLDGPFARNEATLGVNLTGYTNVALAFWFKNIGNKTNGPPAAPFIGGADFDGVALSTDGATWWEIQSLRDIATNVWTNLVINLDSALADHGLAHSSTVYIRFNQYDNRAIPTDGFAIDDITITGTLDTDGDGLPDWWEQLYFSNPTNAVASADSDGDGMTNLQEFLAGTNPRDSRSRLSLNNINLSAANGGLILSWPSSTGRTYRVTTSTNLLEGFPFLLTNGIWATPPSNLYTTPPPAGVQQFYRIELE